MKITRSHLRKTIHRVLKESVMRHLDGNISNIVFHSAQMVGEEWGEITVDDICKENPMMHHMYGRTLDRIVSL